MVPALRFCSYDVHASGRSGRQTFEDAFQGGEPMSGSHLFPEHDPYPLSTTLCAAQRLPKQYLQTLLRTEEAYRLGI